MILSIPLRWWNRIKQQGHRIYKILFRKEISEIIYITFLYPNTWQWIITYIPNLSFLAKELIWPVGSDPVDKKQMRGVRASLSSQVFSKFKMTGSVYFSCKEFAMYFLAWESVRSGHQDLEIKIYTKIKIHCLFLLPSPSLS